MTTPLLSMPPRTPMKYFLPLLLLLLPQVAHAQSASALLAGQRQPLQVTVVPVYQAYTLYEQTTTEISVPVTLFVPIRRNWGVSVRAAWAQVSGDGVTDLSGITDAQTYVSYYQPLGKGSIVLGMGLNLPSGKQQLTQEEFATLALLSRNAYNFQTPSFGLGLGFSPSFTLAYPIGEGLAVGVGAAYQYRGGFVPLENMPDPYDPGDEILVTGGFDARLSRTVSLVADVTYTMYDIDTVGEAEVFEAGDKLVTTVQLRHRGVRTQSWLLARYRSRAKSSLAVAEGTLVEEAEKVLPNQADVMAGFRTVLAPSFAVGLRAEVRHFDETMALPGVQTIYGLGGTVEVIATPQLRIPARFVYQGGDISGIEVGVGLHVRL